MATKKEDDLLKVALAENWIDKLAKNRVKDSGKVVVTREEINRVKSALKTLRGFAAAKNKGSSSTWTYGNKKIDTDTYKDQEKLVQLARNLEQNNAIMKKYLNMVETNIIGPDGFLLNSGAKTISDGLHKLDIEANSVIEEAWIKWKKAKYADLTGKNSFNELQRILVRTLKRDGEVLIRKIRGVADESNPFGFSIQVLDPQRIDTSYTTNLGTNIVVYGVEMNPVGKPVAYWLRLPSNNGSDVFNGGYENLKRERVDARDIIHRFKAISQEQTRGIPEGHAVFEVMANLAEFMEAALWASKIGAASSMYLESTGDGPAPTVESTADSITDEDLNGVQDFLMEIDPGTVRMLPQGTKLSKFEPKYPEGNFVGYVSFMLKTIASGLNVSYFLLSNSLEMINFTSSRVGLIEERDGWKREQNFFKESILEDIYEDWLRTSLMNGAIKNESGSKLPAMKYDKFCVYKFHGRRWDWVDPLKDAQASILMIQNDLMSLTQVLAERGIEYEDILQDKKREKDLRTAYGIEEPKPAEGKLAPKIGAQAETEEEDDEESEVAETE